jgi:protein TonB
VSVRSIETAGRWRAAARWSGAAAIVLIAHVTGAWIIARQQPDASMGESASAIMVELAPLPVAPAAEPDASEVQPEPVTEAPEPEIDLPPPPESAEPTFDRAELQPPPPPAPEPELVLPEPPKPVAKRHPEPRPRQERKQEKGQPKPQSKMAAAPAPAASAPGSASSASTSPANWRGALLAHLNRAKRYPSGARQKREEGTVRLSFSIDRTGRVVSYQIRREFGIRGAGSGSSCNDPARLAASGASTRSRRIPHQPDGPRSLQHQLTIFPRSDLVANHPHLCGEQIFARPARWLPFAAALLPAT